MTTTDSTAANSVNIQVGLDAIDALTGLTSQLEAMMRMMCGSGFETFDGFNDNIKQNYLWACAEKAKQIDALAIKIALKEV